ncbi:hypothetical protein [Marinobacter zhejiangensis]|uniref:Uncharacterized protein n=1 Tax=Marinobacter zhejiangensis TaxID=488535 RepID=A0A1I4NK60_9GAMM|nr:hypothetical protein [Marinobacter zhejiangensis]SFM15697.1 hypothetical protein SAMN04487963_1446 [Marinobacter zhejiangensis]
MLKQLWRKTIGHPSLVAMIAEKKEKPMQLRLLPHLTHTGEFHLDRLTTLLTSRYGMEIDQQGDEAIRQLIQYAVRIQDKDVQRELLLFYLNCSPVIQDYLRSAELFSNHPFFNNTLQRDKD